MKVIQELRPHDSGALYILAFAIVGQLVLRRTVAGRLYLLLLICCLFGIFLTWSTAGRFLYPVLLTLHVAAAIGAATSLRYAYRNAR